MDTKQSEEMSGSRSRVWGPGVTGGEAGVAGLANHGWGRRGKHLFMDQYGSILFNMLTYVNSSASHTSRALPRWNGKPCTRPPTPAADHLSDYSGCLSENWRVTKGLTFTAYFKPLMYFGVYWDSEHNCIPTILGYQKLSFLFLDHNAHIGNLWAELGLQMSFI